MIDDNELTSCITANIIAALNEDLSTGDITAQLIPEHMQAGATVTTRQSAVLCGTAWFDACFSAIDKNCSVRWLSKDGDIVEPNQTLCEVRGNARALLTAERCALNFLQTLSATATQTRCYVDAVRGTHAKIMDTRKTLPGLRAAQKYAVSVGGGHNQRIGLFDGVLIKENHILAMGGIRPALEFAFGCTPQGVSIQIEVEDIAQLHEAIGAGATLVLLDNFNLEDLHSAVSLTAKRAQLEASGGITLDTVRAVAETGVDRISIGKITKDLQAIDLSMRFKT